MKEIKAILYSHKAFVSIIVMILVLSLIRIPMGTFNQGSTIDIVSHFALPAFGAPLLYAFLARLGYLSTVKKSKIVPIILLIGVSSEIIWEIFEFNVDWFFGLQWQASRADTVQDLLLAVVGSITGGYLYLKAYAATVDPAGDVGRQRRVK